jgi:hypothetical protein
MRLFRDIFAVLIDGSIGVFCHPGVYVPAVRHRRKSSPDKGGVEVAIRAHISNLIFSHRPDRESISFR